MAIIYEDNPIKMPWRGGKPLNPNSQFNKHLENYFFLKRVLENPKDFVEKHQANKELVTCQKKLDYWSSRSGFDQAAANAETDRLKKLWNGK